MKNGSGYGVFQDKVISILQRTTPFILRIITGTSVLDSSGKQSFIDDWNQIVTKLSDVVSRERGMVPYPSDVVRKIEKRRKSKNPLLQEFLSYIVEPSTIRPPKKNDTRKK